MLLPNLHLTLTSPWVLWVRIAQGGLSLTIVGLLGFTGWAWWERGRLEEQAAQYEEAAAREQVLAQRVVTEAKQAGLDLSEKQLRTLGREVAFADQLLEKRTFSWTRFLGDLEGALPSRISISSVTLNFKDSRITLNGTAKTFRDMTVLVDGLERHTSFDRVVLTNHRVKKTKSAEASLASSTGGGDEQAVEFTLTVSYRSNL